MKILMLGWEFPPLVSGGLATATEGLVSGLTKIGHQIALVLPHFPHETAEKIEELNPHLTIVSPEHPFQPQRLMRPIDPAFISESIQTSQVLSAMIAAGRSGAPVDINDPNTLTQLLSHYDTANIESLSLSSEEKTVLRAKLVEYQMLVRTKVGALQSEFEEAWTPQRSEVSEQTEILAFLATDVIRGPHAGLFDVVHAHDWMSMKALAQLKKSSPLPVVLHVHSTEYDRAGIHGNHRIQSLERMGFHLADRLVAVSHLTRRILIDQYGVPGDKIDVVYNASNLAHVRSNGNNGSALTHRNHAEQDQSPEPLISFVGRVTYQKGPAYFVQAAHRALQLQPNLRFQVIGTGDLLPSMRQLAWELGVIDKFTFHGFQSAKAVEALLARSDVFVMPSVSEPFGIVALEAMAQRIPIIISKQSGVAECLMHALKVDFWDTDLMADRIVSLVRRPRLRDELQRNGSREIDRFNWESSARRCVDVYQRSAVRIHRA